MKKLMTLAALVAACAPAFTAEVTSSNTVGYTKVALPAKTFLMSAVQFNGVGGESGSLNELFKDSNIPYGTELRFLNNNGVYEFYTYLEEAYDESIDDFVTGWGDGEENLVVAGTPVGTGFWVSAPSVCQLTQVGEVEGESVTINLVADAFAMVANPFPQGFNPNEVSWSANIPYGTEIRVLNASGVYDFYTYLEEAYDESIDDFIPGWGDGEENLVSSSIAAPGQGFWIKAPGKNVSLTVSSPVANAVGN